jgi:hypothetical protein
MSKAEMISHSIVLVDDTKIVPNQMIPITNNPFGDLNSKIALIRIMEKVIGEKQEPKVDNSHFEPSFVFEDVIFQSLSLPPRILVQQNSSELSDKLPNIFKEILQELPEIEAKVAAVGINFELFISKDDDENVKAKIFQNKINQGLESASTTLVYKIDDSCKLNLTIADANYKDTKGIYFKANFHITITSDNSLKEALKKEVELLEKANSKVEELLKRNGESYEK